MQNTTSRVKTLIMQAISILRLPHSSPESNDFVPILPKLDPRSTNEYQIHFEKEENVEEEEFSFAPFDPKKGFTFSDEIFENGKIRATSINFEQCTISPLTHDNNILSFPPLLKRHFVVQQLNKFSSQLKRSCKDISQNHIVIEVEASNKKCKKSKSTGFSETWRFRESFKLRSNSDGKDTFVLFNPSNSVQLMSTEAKKFNIISKKGKTEKCKTTFSSHEKLYVMNKRRNESIRQKSFLPYRQNLIGFFTNKNTFSRNHNPF
ncbi:hypothetical protein LR48_Vigan01g120600 [Vigna angularis]|uniref:Uncharacterized protein n=1 Tax=Phaseolus angularis TaxID=3914 RepID=A0A0L9TMG6_PHAAN|nr:hypothetical protein LR48_Vigan01g120600 [Vigna angularis]